MDPDSKIQVWIGGATTYDSKVTEAVEKNDPAIRSAILGVLAEQTAADVATIKGKEALQRRLRGVINEALEAKTGFGRSEEHTSELQSLMRTSYAVFGLKKKKTAKYNNAPKGTDT